jgi:hypothetical protein
MKQLREQLRHLESEKNYLIFANQQLGLIK